MSKANTPYTARSLALQILERCQAAGSYANLALDSALNRYPLPSADRGLLTALVYGVIERQTTLDWYISQLSDRTTDQLDPQVLTILRMGLYQLIYMDRIPEHAAVNESVDLSTKRSTGFVNAVLRNYLRKKEALSFPTSDENPFLNMSLQVSVPQKLCIKLSECYGTDKTFRILEAFGQHTTITLRVNTLLISQANFIQLLKDHNIEAIPTPLAHTGVQISEMPIREIPGYDKGLFFVQDEASQLCVEALRAKPGMQILDTCACPGSKTFGIAIQMENKGDICACDLHENKLSLIASGAKRMGIHIIHTMAHNGQEEFPSPECLFDRILCDVPCSGYGVLGKKPEIRHKDPDDSINLPSIQYSILSQAAKQLKPHGRLVYSTCTLLPEENEKNVLRFVSEHPNYKLCSDCVGALSIPNGYITLTPDEHHTDGFFIAILERNE